MIRAFPVECTRTDNSAIRGVVAAATCPTDPTWVPSSSASLPATRGLHSFTFQLNVSAFYGIRGVFRGCEGCLEDVRGYWGVLGGVSGAFCFRNGSG